MSNRDTWTTAELRALLDILELARRGKPADGAAYWRQQGYHEALNLVRRAIGIEREPKLSDGVQAQIGALHGTLPLDN